MDELFVRLIEEYDKIGARSRLGERIATPSPPNTSHAVHLGDVEIRLSDTFGNYSRDHPISGEIRAKNAYVLLGNTKELLPFLCIVYNDSSDRLIAVVDSLEPRGYFSYLVGKLEGKILIEIER